MYSQKLGYEIRRDILIGNGDVQVIGWFNLSIKLISCGKDSIPTLRLNIDSKISSYTTSSIREEIIEVELGVAFAVLCCEVQ